MEKVRAEWDDLHSIDKDLITSFRDFIDMEQSGIGEDIWGYIEAAKKANRAIRDNAEILDEFAINIETDNDKYEGKFLSLVERIIYYTVNPWKLIMNVVGRETLNLTVAEGNEFKEFSKFQKRYLRDFLDPRKIRLLRTACRGGSKTFDAAAGSFATIYLNPFTRILVTSGSQKQSDALFKYFKIMAEKTPILKLMDKGKIFRRHTDTIVNGWFEAMPASMVAVKGPRPDKVIVDEACEEDSNVIYAAFSGAITSHSMKLLMQGTPDKMDHLFHDYFEEYFRQVMMTPSELAELPSWKRWHGYEQSAFECPWITKQQIDLMTDLYGGTGSHLYKINVLGKFAPASGLVFDADKVQDSLIDELPKEVAIDVAMDGEVKSVPFELNMFTDGLDVGHAHPTAACLAGRGNDGYVYILESWEKRSAEEEQILKKFEDLVQAHPGLKVLADDAPIQFYMNRKLKYLLSELGCSLKAIPFSSNKGPMISNVRALFETDIIRILRRPCEKLINQLLSYAYDKNTGKPQKTNDDHVDGFMLTCWGHKDAYIKKRFRGGPYKSVYNFDELVKQLEPDRVVDDEEDLPYHVSKNVFKRQTQYPFL